MSKWRSELLDQELVKAVEEYTNKLYLDFSWADCEDLVEHMDVFEIADIKTGLEHFLNAYKGVYVREDV
jgi:hypothetical protein